MFYILSNRGNYVVISIWIADYVLIKWMPNLENYLLCKVDFFGAALKFKALSNTLALNAHIIMMLMILYISYSYMYVACNLNVKYYVYNYVCILCI